MRPTVPELLNKLAALGDEDHIAMAMAEQGIKGTCGAHTACIVAEYLKAECPELTYISVGISGPASCSSGRAVWRRGATDADHETTLPKVVNDFAFAFDRWAYPGLTRQGRYAC